MAEGAFRAAAERAGLEVTAASAGTAGYHIGEAPDPRAIATAQAHGVAIGHYVGRQLARDDFYEFTHIFALDRANLEGIRARAPRDGTAEVALLMDLVPGREGEAVKDPYYGDEAGFETTWADVTQAADALIERLSRRM